MVLRKEVECSISYLDQPDDLLFPTCEMRFVMKSRKRWLQTYH